MLLLLRSAMVGIVSLLLISAPAYIAQAQSTPTSKQLQTKRTEPHRVVIQVTQNDPSIMNMALNNAENLIKYYEEKGEKVEVEFVAYGAGLHMLRGDTSPVKDRLATMQGKLKNVTFSGCENTMGAHSKQENKEITLVPEARIVRAGIARVVELQEQGWTYVRP